MARTKQNACRSTGGKVPRKQLQVESAASGKSLNQIVRLVKLLL